MPAITLTGGQQVRRGGVFQSQRDITAVTGTATNTLAVDTDVVTLNGPTATVSNFLVMEAGSEGQEVMLVYSATGEGGGTTASAGDIQVHATGTATGEGFRRFDSLTFRQVDQYARLKFMNARWHVMERTTFEEHRSTGTDIVLPVTVDGALLVRSTGTDALYTLADGFEGQRYMLTTVAGTAVRTVTPANMFAYTSLSLDQTATQGGQGVWAELQFAQGNWHLMSGANLSATSISHISDAIVTN